MPATVARIDELRRRVELDPASLAFGPLAEEYRRAGQVEEAIATCRAGLAHHPEYVAARVTLGRALLDRGDTAAAQAEFEQVIRQAPENLAAIRGLAEIHRRPTEGMDAANAAGKRTIPVSAAPAGAIGPGAGVGAAVPAAAGGTSTSDRESVERLERFLGDIAAARNRLQR